MDVEFFGIGGEELTEESLEGDAMGILASALRACRVTHSSTSGFGL